MTNKYHDILDEIESTFETKKPESEEEMVVFWHTTPKGTIKINFRKLKRWLHEHGYFRYEFVEGKVNFIKITNNIVENITALDIKNFVLYNLDQWDQDEIWNTVFENAKFKDEYLSALDVSNPDFLVDDRKTSWFFYQNTAIKVTSNGIENIDYSEIKGCIWKTSIIKRDFKYKDYKASDFYRFILNLSASDDERMSSLCSGIGYLLHRFKDPSNPKGVMLYEEYLGNKPSGGTGKTLIIQATGKLRELVILDAKLYDNNNQFALQRVNPSTNIILFDDPPKNFNMETQFSSMSTGLSINKKNKPEIYLEFKKSPKYAYSSNYVFKGNSSSFKRRKFEIEIHQFYSDKHQPIDDFGREFWSEQWTELDYNMFDSCMLKNCELFLKHGLIEYNYENLDTRRIAAQTSTEFYDWACINLVEGERYKRNEMFSKFQHDEPGSYCKTANMFYNWMREYAEFKGWDVKDNIGSGKMYIEFGEVDQNELPIDFTEVDKDDVPF